MIQDNEAVAADKGYSRKKIRKKVVELLKGNTAAGTKVFPNASVPPWEEELPVILVYPRTEPTDVYATAPREYARSLSLAIEIIAAGPEENDELVTPDSGVTSLEDVLDDIAQEIEDIFDKDDSLDGNASESFLTNSEFEFDADGGQPIGSCRLTYNVIYHTMSPRDTSDQENIEDFEGNDIEYNISTDENTREAEDTVNLPT